MSIDVAGSGADETGVCISKFLNGNIFIFYCSGLAGGYDERTLGKITELAVRDIIHGKQIKNIEALANPEALEQFKNIAELKI